MAFNLRNRSFVKLLDFTPKEILFQPLLYQVATAVLSPDNIAGPIRKVLRGQKNATEGLAEMVGVDLNRKRVIRGPRSRKSAEPRCTIDDRVCFNNVTCIYGTAGT